ncbi:MAG: energy-coupling factor transporter ATPase [Clostridiales bacterium]|nr:energy-coupling factor transporter ATPase [Clostridiales bacterium]
MRCESVYTEMIEGISADMDVENISIETKDIDSSIDGEETENSVGNLEKNANKIIRVEHIEYIYQPGTSYEKKAVDDVSLDIYEGELLGIIGHTGSGKSTLIQHLNGLIKPTSGKVYFQDEDIYDGNHSMADLRKNVGLVFQYPEYQLFENTVLEDVCFGPLNLGCTKEEAIDRAKLAMKMVGVKESMYERSPFELSGGEKRRVAIAGVLAMEPKVLILDEPTAGLDPKGRDEILGMLKELQKTRDITVVLVSHSMEDMAKYADRIIVMNHAKLMYEGTPQTVFRKYKELEKMGLAAPQVTYIIEKLKQSGIDISGEALSSKEAARLIVEAI